ncbi:hypothetical protein QBC47DRAFT_305726 [Echria macrotheca]|uniref:Uncharacterized protein n=1 Tax=Echria macrotheca TaxID=438768 RepID=A0AAJ0F8W7_9PEZI|nr:hypothetical protein QBC47DRAFT_305726 [Echria macrotheca]
MAPIRRYLRITKYSVLEVRIYLDNPALAQSWLLNPRDPVLPRVIESVRPLVLPKLREERERERSNKKNKKKSIKDVVVQDGFEVSIFLTGTDTRHSILHKHKLFRDKTQTKLTSNSSRLTGGDTTDAPIDVDQQFADDPIILREESPSDQEPIDLDGIPDFQTSAPDAADAAAATGIRRPKRRRQDSGDFNQDSPDAHDENVHSVSDDASSDDDGDLFGDEDASDDADRRPPAKRARSNAPTATAADEKKKLAMDISYEGFAIYGRVLCLVVKRRGAGPGAGAGSGSSRGGLPAGMSPAAARTQPGRMGGQAIMENWITSTQLPEGVGVEEDDEGP